MADDIRSSAGLDPREEAARRIRDGELRRAAAREAMTQEQMRERAMREMAARRAAQAAAAAAPEAEMPSRPANPRPNVASRVPAAAGAAVRGASRAVPGMNVVRGVQPTSLQPGADFEREGMRRVRMADERARMEQELGEAGDRMPTSPPAPRPAPAPARRAAPAAPRRREMTADELNALAMGERGQDADAEIARMRIEQRRRELEDRGTAFKKGGMVKPKAKPVAKKAGGMIAAKPAAKKMMKGGMVAKPKVAVKAKAKPMPFKKGGAVKKGKR